MLFFNYIICVWDDFLKENFVVILFLKEQELPSKK